MEEIEAKSGADFINFKVQNQMNFKTVNYQFLLLQEKGRDEVK